MAGDLIQRCRIPDLRTRQRWLALAEKALAGAILRGCAGSHTDDGIRIEPLMPRVTTQRRARAGRPRRRRGSSSSASTIPIPAAPTAQALEDVAQGATGLSLVFEGAPNAFGYGLPRTAEALETVLRRRAA